MLGVLAAVSLAVAILPGVAGADVASPYRGAGVYVSSGAGSWHGLYLGIPGVPAGRGAACTFPGGAEPDSGKAGGGYARTGSNSSNNASLTIKQLAFAFARYGNDGNAGDGEALDALVEQNINGGTYFLSAAGQASYTKIVTAAKKYKGATPTVTGLVTSPTGRAGVTYTATVTGDPSTSYNLSAAGATLLSKSVTTSSTGKGTFKYSVPTSNTSHNFSVTVSGAIYARMDQYAAVDQAAQQSQTVTTWGSGPVSSVARGSVEPLISASITKLIAGDATKTPQAATFKVVNKTTDATLTNSFTTLAGKPTPLLQGFVPCDTFVFTETKPPAGAYIPSPGSFNVTIPCNASEGFAIVLADPRIPVVTVGTQVNLERTTYNVALSDAVTVGGDDHEAGTITAQLRFLAGVACSAATVAQWGTAQQIGSYGTPVIATFGDGNGNGTYTIAGPTPTAAQDGAWGWFETVRLTPSGASASSPFGVPHECTDVTAPTVTSQASEPVGLGGDQLTDTLAVVGVSQNPPATERVGQVGSQLYLLPYNNDGTLCPIAGTAAGKLAWAQAISAGAATVVSAQSWPITNDTTFVTDVHQVATPGCYTYVTTFTPTGPDQSPATIGPAGSTGESTTIVAPKVNTVVHTGPPGGQTSVVFTDTATITGTHGVPTTLVDKLVGPAAPDASHSCAHAAYRPGAVAGVFAPITVTADGTVTTNSITLARGAKAACYIGWESLTIPGPNGTPRTAYTSPLGSETTEMALAPGRAAAAAAGGGYVVPPTTVNTGRPGPGRSGPVWARWAGSGVALGCGLVGFGLLYRRRTDLP